MLIFDAYSGTQVVPFNLKFPSQKRKTTSNDKWSTASYDPKENSLQPTSILTNNVNRNDIFNIAN